MILKWILDLLVIGCLIWGLVGGYFAGMIRIIFRRMRRLAAAVFAFLLASPFGKLLARAFLVDPITEKLSAYIAVDADTPEQLVEQLPLVIRWGASLFNVDLEAMASTSSEGTSAAEAFAGKVALPVANVIGTVIAFVLLYFVFRIAIRLVGRLLHGVFELPGLRIVNRIGGVLFGLLFSLVFTWIAVKVLTWGFSLFSESDVALLRGFDIEQSFIAKYFYHFNPLDTLLSIK